MFAPVLNAISGGTATGTTVQRRAIAQTAPYICHAPPLMMCDLVELSPLLDPTLKANIGRQIRLKEPLTGGGSWAPGNFGLLALPDGSSGANDISGASENGSSKKFWTKRSVSALWNYCSRKRAWPTS